MSKFELVQYYYINNLWNKSRVYNAVNKWITKEEYKLIVGEDFE